MVVVYFQTGSCEASPSDGSKVGVSPGAKIVPAGLVGEAACLRSWIQDMKKMRCNVPENAVRPKETSEQVTLLVPQGWKAQPG